jgi:SAM-dependent methyltransferase
MIFYRIIEKLKNWSKNLISKTIHFNLAGDREIEYSWTSANIREGHGNALDLGCGDSWMGLLAARKGYNVIAIDINRPPWYYYHENLEFLKKDIFKAQFPENHFDLILNISTIEHIGLKGRFGVEEQQSDGDLKAMNILKSNLKSEGQMILTLPVGKDVVHYPYHRIYGSKRLSKLLSGWKVIKKEFWIKDKNKKWQITKEEIALSKTTNRFEYGLGLFLLSN